MFTPTDKELLRLCYVRQYKEFRLGQISREDYLSTLAGTRKAADMIRKLRTRNRKPDPATGR